MVSSIKDNLPHVKRDHSLTLVEVYLSPSDINRHSDTDCFFFPFLLCYVNSFQRVELENNITKFAPTATLKHICSFLMLVSWTN